MQYLLNFFFSAMAILRTFFLNQPHSHKYISPRLSKSILWGRNFETKTFFRNLEYFKTHLYQFHVTSLFSQVPPENTRNRTSRRRYSIKKGALKNFAIFKGRTPVLEPLFNKVAGLQDCNFIKEILRNRCFPMNIAKFLRKSILKTSWNGCFYKKPLV